MIFHMNARLDATRIPSAKPGSGIREPVKRDRHVKLTGRSFVLLSHER
jgi:hypothetical protein